MIPDGESRSSFRWWLRLQIGLALTGGATWLAGAVLQQEFVSGVGLGLLLGALALRLGRTSSD